MEEVASHMLVKYAEQYGPFYLKQEECHPSFLKYPPQIGPFYLK